MKKTLTINLGGTVYHIDEDAYHLLAMVDGTTDSSGSAINTGIDNVAYPNPRTFLFGIDFKF